MDRRIRDAFPLPSERPDYVPFSWKLDGGGRDLLLDLITGRDVRVMVEVGVLYGGSALQWLRHKADLTLIGIDPWAFDADQVRYWWGNRHAYGIDNLDAGGLSDDAFLKQLLRPDAAYFATISNLWDFRDRFVPIRGRSPEMLHTVAALGVVPDLVYFDSDKELVDLDVCRALWPAAIISGDDWWWSPEGQPDAYPVQKAVQEFAAKHGLTVMNHAATWYLAPGAAGEV